MPYRVRRESNSGSAFLVKIKLEMLRANLSPPIDVNVRLAIPTEDAHEIVARRKGTREFCSPAAGQEVDLDNVDSVPDPVSALRAILTDAFPELVPSRQQLDRRDQIVVRQPDDLD